MTPLELLARLAALVPPPRYPLVRYHGVLAPRSAWRREVVPRPPAGANSDVSKRAVCNPSNAAPATANREAAGSPRGRRLKGHQQGVDGARSCTPGGTRQTAHRRAADGERAWAAAEARPAAEGVADALVPRHRAPDDVDVEPLAPNVLRLRHWCRLMDGLLYATGPRLPWSRLLRRTFDVDVTACATCKGRLRVVEVVTATDAARRILERLGLPTEPPRRARVRDPTTLDGDELDAS